MQNTKPAAKTPWPVLYLDARGVPIEKAKERGVVVHPNSTTNDGHIKFQKFHPLTGEELAGSRTRYEKSWTDKNGKEQHWKQAPDSGNFPYFAQGLPWAAWFHDLDVPIIVSEGETRALVGAVQDIPIPIVGCGGCNGVFEAGSQRQRLHPIFKEMAMKRGKKQRHIILAFDADTDSNDNVHSAESAAIKLFIEGGAIVHPPMRLPRVTAGGKDGIDDVIHALGIGAFKAMLYATLDAPALKADVSSTDIEAVVICAADVDDKPMEYLGSDRIPIPLEMLSGLCGHPGEGKTQMCLAIAADGSRGIDTFNKAKIKPFRTLYWTNESLPRTLRRRYRAQGGDVKSLFILTGGKDASGKPVSLTINNIAELEQAMTKWKAKFLVIDPVQSFIGAKVDMHRANEMRPLMDGLSGLAEKLKIAILVLRHLSKERGSHAVTRALGSVDITAKIRTEYMLGHAPNDVRSAALVHSKPGECRRVDSLAYEISEVKRDTPKIEWKGKSELTLTDINAPETTDKKAGSKIERCVGYLSARLEKGPVKVADVLALGVYDARTVQRAAERIGVVREGSKRKGEVTMKLPPFARFSARSAKGQVEKKEERD
jgi:AAA domain/Domain of unknown function (DUF3854)